MKFVVAAVAMVSSLALLAGSASAQDRKAVTPNGKYTYDVKPDGTTWGCFPDSRVSGREWCGGGTWSKDRSCESAVRVAWPDKSTYCAVFK